MEMLLRALNLLLWSLIWTSGVLVSHAAPDDGLFDAWLYADPNRFLGQGFLFLVLLVVCDLTLIWINQKPNRRQAP